MVNRDEESLTTADPQDVFTWSPTPTWLLVPPTGSEEPTPVATSHQLLPTANLTWKDFERLCLRLLMKEADPVHVSPLEATEPVVRLYGVSGQAQAGIDVYARDRLVLGEKPPVRHYVSLQARRTHEVAPGALTKCIEEFLSNKWSPVSRKFIFATSASTASTKLLDESEGLASQLAEESIEFVVWDQEEISRQLKEHPELVDDFFGREWVRLFCGDEAAKGLRSRLDVKQVASLRQDLNTIYKAAFGIADSGQLAFKLGGTPTVGLLDRFVTPDLVHSSPQAASQPQIIDVPGDSSLGDDSHSPLSEAAISMASVLDEGAWFLHSSGQGQRRAESRQMPERIRADLWVGTGSRQVIVGEPGAGKSTLLRYLALDLLSEEPGWREVARRWGNHLPVWLPFHFFTQRIAGRTGAEASVGEALKAWLEQNGSGHVWPLVEQALNDDRLLLIVDGLDEWISEEAGQSAIATLRTFADARSIPLVVSSRPYGLGRLALGDNWSHARISPLTVEQQRLLASHYFQSRTDTEDGQSLAGVIESSVDKFLSQIQGTPDLRAISRVPLFLVLLVGLHLSSDAKLPAGRFEVYDRAVRLLIEDHRAQRRAAAAVTAPRNGLSDSQIRTVLARVAFVNQHKGNFSALPEIELRKDFVDALQDPDGLAMVRESAAAAADDLMAVAEGDIGLLVRKGPTDLGFLHRTLQEQLAAEFIADRFTPTETKEMFTERVGDPRWSEVILATMSRLTRPTELRELLAALRECIDESLSGLRAREVVAELTFGPYDLPAIDIQQSAVEIIETIETHTYGPHRARLLSSFITGLGGTTTKDIVRKCLERWTLLTQEPSNELVKEIGDTPASERVSDIICKLLLRAICYSDSSVAYTGAIVIANRCSVDGVGDNTERFFLRQGLIGILNDPPSGLSSAAALLALALEWQDDPVVTDILHEARSHAEESVRVVALSEALGVLRPLFARANNTVTHKSQALNDEEREWLFGRINTFSISDTHWGLLVSSISDVASNFGISIDHLIDGLRGSARSIDGYFNRDLAWSVLLEAFADEERVVQFVCDQLCSSESSMIANMTWSGQSLLSSYPVGSPHNSRIASAIENRISQNDSSSDILGSTLRHLAAVDRGPKMKRLLLDELDHAAWPHWAASALADYFDNDEEVETALLEAIHGEPIRAAEVALVANRILPSEEAIPHLLSILRELKNLPNAGSARHDIVASALIQARQEQEIGPGPELETIAEEALALLPAGKGLLHEDLRFEVARGFYPSQASQRMLTELKEVQDLPLAPLLRVFREDSKQTSSLLDKAEAILCSLPAHLRAQICQSLAFGAVAPETVMALTRRWADETSGMNKSIASLAFHRSLRQSWEEGRIEDEEWRSTQAHLGDQAASYGPDHEARRRSAWVGICVCKDWSVLEDRFETIGEALPIGVRLVDGLYGPDRTLLDQLLMRWEELQDEFGNTILLRLSGMRKGDPSSEVWGALALVAHRNIALQQELDNAIADDPKLLNQDGVLAWFATRANKSADTIADVLVTRIRNVGHYGKDFASVLLAEPEQIGLNRQEIESRLEEALSGGLEYSGDLLLEALALLNPEHSKVGDLWLRYSEIIATRRDREEYPIPLRTYFAVACAAADASEVLDSLMLHLETLDTDSVRQFDDTFTRHFTHRLRRDAAAAEMVRDAISHPTTSDSQAAVLAAFAAEADVLDTAVLIEVERRLANQIDVSLAPIVRDCVVSATLSVRNILTRVADAVWEAPHS